jgi:hypothetical protein
MATRCIESVVLNSTVNIPIPTGANCMATKHGKCIFAHANPHFERGYFAVPENARIVSFPQYRRHGDRYIFYGQPVFSGV